MSESEEKNIDDSIEDTEGEMSFFDHLDEMRKRIIISVVGILIASVIAGVFITEIMEYILIGPAKSVNMTLQNLRPFGQPFLYFKVIFASGIIIAFPFVLYQVWRFVAPGLYQNERNWARKITLFTSLCFLSGVFFSYFVMIPSMLSFAVSFQTEGITNIIDVNEYFGFIIMILLASGLLFEMPMASYVLAKVGILTAKAMRKYRRHSIVVILILAAVLTPTPDPVSQFIFAAPLFILYEISIIIARLAQKKQEADEEATS